MKQQFKLQISYLCLGSLLSAQLLLACGGSAAPAAGAESAAPASAQATTAPAAAPLPAAVNAGQTPNNALLDDLEDGNNQTVVSEMRGGYWYTYADSSSKVEPTGTFQPASGGADGSKFAARMSGKVGDAQYPFVGMGFSIYEPKGGYDLSKCTGISFKTKKGTPTSTGMLRMKVGDVHTVPEAGVCKSCFNDFGRDVLLTETWSEITTAFHEMRQEAYWGEPYPAIDAARIYQLQWQVKEKGAEVDVWVDDVKLVGCGQ